MSNICEKCHNSTDVKWYELNYAKADTSWSTGVTNIVGRTQWQILGSVGAFICNDCEKEKMRRHLRGPLLVIGIGFIIALLYYFFVLRTLKASGADANAEIKIGICWLLLLGGLVLIAMLGGGPLIKGIERNFFNQPVNRICSMQELVWSIKCPDVYTRYAHKDAKDCSELTFFRVGRAFYGFFGQTPMDMVVPTAADSNPISNIQIVALNKVQYDSLFAAEQSAGSHL